jgi:hypothetical protein
MNRSALGRLPLATAIGLMSVRFNQLYRSNLVRTIGLYYRSIAFTSGQKPYASHQQQVINSVII